MPRPFNIQRLFFCLVLCTETSASPTAYLDVSENVSLLPKDTTIAEEIVDLEAGRRDYALHCEACHGSHGEGNGRLARILDPPPARLADPQLLENRTDAELYRTIAQGIPATGLSEGMAAWEDMLAPEQIRNLVAFIRTLQRAAASK
jgi:mono/diheme cytochrome c family protein